MQIRLSTEGDVGMNGGPHGNLYIAVLVKEHKVFRREGYDLIYELPLNFVQAALGDEVEVATLNGSDEVLKIPPGTQSGSVFRIKGKGVSELNGGRRGDLVIPVKVEVPTSVDPRQRRLLEELGQTLAKPDDGQSKEKGLLEKIKDAFS